MPHGLDTVSAQLKAELDRLKATPVADAVYLADLGSRLAALATYLGDHPELAALARDLQTAELPLADLVTLRTRAIEVLTRLTTPSPGTPPGPEPGPEPRPGSDPEPRRPFWKRP